MNNRVFNIGNPLYTESATPKQSIEEAIAEEERFAKILDRFDALQETAEEHAERLKAEDAQALERKKRQQKIMDLQSLISELRSRLAGLGGQDPGIEARLSAAQTELFWLMFSF